MKQSIKEDNETSKQEIMKYWHDQSEKLASVCIPLGISGMEAKHLSPEHLRLLVEALVNKSNT